MAKAMRMTCDCEYDMGRNRSYSSWPLTGGEGCQRSDGGARDGAGVGRALAGAAEWLRDADRTEEPRGSAVAAGWAGPLGVRWPAWNGAQGINSPWLGASAYVGGETRLIVAAGVIGPPGPARGRE